MHLFVIQLADKIEDTSCDICSNTIFILFNNKDQWTTHLEHWFKVFSCNWHQIQTLNQVFNPTLKFKSVSRLQLLPCYWTWFIRQNDSDLAKDLHWDMHPLLAAPPGCKAAPPSLAESRLWCRHHVTCSWPIRFDRLLHRRLWSWD